MPPRISYLICGTPRSGSFLLSEALSNADVAGRPAEYFWREDEPAWAERWKLPEGYSYRQYLDAALVHGTTPNGVFASKLMWGYRDDVTAKLRSIPGYASLSLPDLLGAAFPNLRYIWLSRRDKLGQAISHWKAMQTGIWAWTQGERPVPAEEPRFDLGAIDYLYKEVQAHDESWERYFAENGIDAHRVIYEELVERYDDTIREALAFLGIALPADLDTGDRKMRRQADQLSEQWRQRYLAESGDQ